MSRLLFAVLLGLALAPASAAELYKWVDEHGVVNYGDAPPAGARQVRALDEDRSSLSIVPGLSPEELERQRKSLEQARSERLQRELAELQRPPAPAPAPVAQTQDYTTWYPAYGYGYPLHRPHPPGHRPVKPMPPKLPLEPPAPPLYSRPR